MKNVVLYPFNKITQGILRFRDLLEFEIAGVLDFVFSTGKDAVEEITKEKSGIMITDNIDKAFENVDTLILNEEGVPLLHFSGFYNENKLGERWKEVLLEAKKRNIKIVSTHILYNPETMRWISENEIKVEFSKQIAIQDIDGAIPSECETRLLDNMKRIGIYATRSCIGKYTTQMTLFRYLRDKMKTTVLITEPTGFLFGQPEMYNVLFGQEKMVDYIRGLVKKEAAMNTECMIYAEQGSMGKVDEISWNMSKIAYLKGFMPNEYLLVSGYDAEEDEHIERVIKMMKLFAGIDAPYAFLIPDRVEKEYGIYEFKSDKEIEERKEYIMKKYKPEKIELIKDVARIYS